MATFEYSVTGQSITTTKAGWIVSGTVGVYTVKFTFDSSWDGLEKWASFDPNPGQAYKQPLDANGECEIPGEVMGGVQLRIGAFGIADGQAYPTVWANKLSLEEGCFVEIPMSEWPEPAPVIEEILEELENKVDKPASATAGNVAIFDNNLNIKDSGKSLSDIYDAAMIQKTASGSIVTITDGADDVPIKTMTVQIEPNQVTKTTPVSPSNIWTIYPWENVAIHRTQKNLWGGQSAIEQCKRYMPSGTYDENNQTFDFSAAGNVVYDGRIIGFVPLKFKENTRYTFFFTLDKTTGAGLNLNAVYTDGTSVAIPGAATPGTKQTFVYTTSANKTLFYIGKRNSSGHTILYLDECGCFEGALTTSEFESYVGNTYAIEFPTEAGTVYGGELTVNEDGTGTLTVNKEMVTISQIAWSRVALGDHYVFRSNNLYGTYSQQGWCECYNVVTGVSATNVPDDCILLRSNTWDSNNRIAIRDDTYEDVTAFKNAMGSYKIVREAKNPATYQLTAPQVSTLLGLNNIWADTGEISITYRADPTLATAEQTQAIKESIAYYQTDYTAKQAYVVNDLVYVVDVLYIVTSAIAQGATMTPNTNCHETTLNIVIKSLR